MAEADENFTTNLYIFLDLFGIKIPTTVNSLSTMKNYDLTFKGFTSGTSSYYHAIGNCY